MTVIFEERHINIKSRRLQSQIVAVEVPRSERRYVRHSDKNTNAECRCEWLGNGNRIVVTDVVVKDADAFPRSFACADEQAALPCQPRGVPVGGSGC